MERSVIGLDAAGEWPQLKELLGDMKDKDFIDLGCGYGWHCAYAVTAGAKSVVGIDQSEKMLSKAMEINAHPLIQYRNERIETFIPDFECCDLVLSNLVLHYIRELTVVYRNVYAALRKNGIYMNTFSKTIASAMRVGYMILPEPLLDVFHRQYGQYSCTVPIFEQLVIAELIRSGNFERHINRIRRKRRKSYAIDDTAVPGNRS